MRATQLARSTFIFLLSFASMFPDYFMISSLSQSLHSTIFCPLKNCSFLGYVRVTLHRYDTAKEGIFRLLSSLSRQKGEEARSASLTARSSQSVNNAFLHLWLFCDLAKTRMLVS